MKKFGFKFCVCDEYKLFKTCRSSDIGTSEGNFAIDCNATTVQKIYENFIRIIYSGIATYVMWVGFACGFELFILAWIFPNIIFIGTVHTQFTRHIYVYSMHNYIMQT